MTGLRQQILKAQTREEAQSLIQDGMRNYKWASAKTQNSWTSALKRFDRRQIEKLARGIQKALKRERYNPTFKSYRALA